ncbi:MAG: Fcf2 pre-rRNA processing-domain-containing protein, partial [Benjaminiella poitrasii]
MASRMTRSLRRQLESKTQQKIDLDNLSQLDVEKLASNVDGQVGTKQKGSNDKLNDSVKQVQSDTEEDMTEINQILSEQEEKAKHNLSEDNKADKAIESTKEEENKGSFSEEDDDSSEEDSDEDSSSEISDDDDDDEVDLDELLNKAEKALAFKNDDTIQLEKGTKQQNKFDVINTKLPKLDSGISTKKELYFKEVSGRTKLIPEAVALIDSDEKPSEKATVVLKASKDQERRMSKKERQAEREKTTGKEWFDMPKADITEEVKRDLQVLKMRHILDRKRHYKKMGKRPDPKYFQIGTIIEGPTEFYSSRINKKDRKQTIVDELMSNDDLKQYYKRKYNEVQERTTSGGKKHYKKLKAQRQRN